MVYLATNTPDYYAELCDEIRFFLDERKIAPVQSVQRVGYTVWHEWERRGEPEGVRDDAQRGQAAFSGEAPALPGRFCHTCILYLDGREQYRYAYETCGVPEGAGLEFKKICKRGAKIAVFRCLREHFGEEKPWGSLTGVRPSKFLRDSRAQLGELGARRLFLMEFDLFQQKYARQHRPPKCR